MFVQSGYFTNYKTSKTLLLKEILLLKDVYLKLFKDGYLSYLKTLPPNTEVFLCTLTMQEQ